MTAFLANAVMIRHLRRRHSALKPASARRAGASAMQAIRDGRPDMNDLATIGIFFAGFFGGLGVFFLGVGLLWWVSLTDRAMKRQQAGDVRG
ncbi:hypothetical protein C7T96_12520 [Nitratireductor sp. StC3]|nr:hypothetical protein C7T96_12520 [Nitratireductor sp. StC3]